MTNRDPVSAPAVRVIRHELSFRSLLSIVAVGASLWLLVRIWPIMLLLRRWRRRYGTLRVHQTPRKDVVHDQWSPLATAWR